MENKEFDEKKYKIKYWKRISEFFGTGKKTNEFKMWLIVYVCANGETGNSEMDDIFTTLKSEFNDEKIRNFTEWIWGKKTDKEKKFIDNHREGIKKLCSEKRDFTVEFMKWIIDNKLLNPFSISFKFFCQNQTMSEEFINYLISKRYLHKDSFNFCYILKKQKLSEIFINSLFNQEYLDYNCSIVSSICDNPWVSKKYKRELCRQAKMLLWYDMVNNSNLENKCVNQKNTKGNRVARRRCCFGMNCSII